MVDFLHVRSFKNKLPEVVSLFYLNNSEVQTHILTWQVHTASAKSILLFHLLLVVVGCGRRCHLHLPTTVTHWLLHVVLLLLLHRCPWHLSVCIRTLRSLGGLQKNKYKILLLFITKKTKNKKQHWSSPGKKTKKNNALWQQLTHYFCLMKTFKRVELVLVPVLEQCVSVKSSECFYEPTACFGFYKPFHRHPTESQTVHICLRVKWK